MTLRFGSCFFALLFALGLGSDAHSQVPGTFPGGPAIGAGYRDTAGRTQKSDTMVDVYGQPAVLPVNYCEACPPMGGAGYGACGSGDGWPDAFGGASLNVDQCGPHYFDFAIEGLYWRRQELGNRTINFTSANIGGPIILSTGSIGPVPENFQVLGGFDDSEYEPGFRLTGRFDIGALSVAELIFTGFYEQEQSATAIDLLPQSPTQGNLFSLFSEFGLNPMGGIGLPETDRAVLHRIEYESDFHSAELSCRRYWIGHSPRVSGTLLAGFRYAQLRESLAFHTEANGTFDLVTITDNNLYGFQSGFDAWYTIVQGLRIGTEGKAGIYLNQLYVYNRGVSSDGAPSINENFDEDHAAFIGEQRLDVVADILPSLSIKVGVEALFVNSVALAIENFNTGSPYPAGVPRVPFIADQGEALYYGYHAGIEYVW